MQIASEKGWCQELVCVCVYGSYLKKLFIFNSQKKQLLMKCNVKETYYTIF